MARYKKQERINSGGFGVVYRAVRVEDSEIVAYKELPLGANEEEKKRFAREVRIQAKLEHKHIVPILGYNLQIEAPFFVMPIAEASLRERLGQIAGDTHKVFSIFHQLLDGLEYAHDNGVIHRDLKPENVLFFPDIDDWVMIADFGLGKRLDFETLTITRSHESLGTAAYMPPEQCLDLKRVDHRADIFSLGKILYVNVKDPRIAGGYAFIIGKCLEHDPEERYASVKALRDDFNLLTETPQKFEEPMKTAESLLQSILENGDPQKVRELDDLLGANSGDEAFIMKIFPRLPPIVVEIYHRSYRHRFYERLKLFDTYLNVGLPFDYTDTVAAFYSRVFQLEVPPDVKRLILSRLIVMGCKHNRWNVRDMLCSLLAKLKDESDAFIARDVIKAHPKEAAWSGEGCKRSILPPVVAQAFDECAALTQ